MVNVKRCCLLSVIVLGLGNQPTVQAQGGRTILFNDKHGLIFFVVQNAAAQDDIGIDETTASKISDIAEKYREERAAVLGRRSPVRIPARQLDNEDREKRREEQKKELDDIRKITDRFVQQLQEVLSRVQFNRLLQILWQLDGSVAWISDERLKKPLNLTDEQISTIREINKEYEVKLMMMTKNKIRVDPSQLDRERDEKAKEVLTNEQQDKLAEVLGMPFDTFLLHRYTARSAG